MGWRDEKPDTGPPVRGSLKAGRLSKMSDQRRKKCLLDIPEMQEEPAFHLKGYKINKQICLRVIKKDKV